MVGGNDNGSRSTPSLALVTGGSGFIGSHVVRALLAEGTRVRVLVQEGVPLHNLAGLDVEQAFGDLRDRASLDRALAGVDTVFHAAAIFAYWLPDPADMFRVNVEGTVRLLAAARDAGVRLVVHTSSIAAVGTRPGEDPADEATQFNDWDTADGYILSKYIAETEALRYNAVGLPVVVVNPAFPFGEGDIAPTPTGLLVQRYISGQNPFVFRGGFNVVDVRDVARGHLLAARAGRPGERYILGGHNITYRAFGDAVCRMAGVPLPRWEVPTAPFAAVGKVLEWVSDHVTRSPPLMVDKALRYTTGRHIYVSTEKARRELGYSPGPWEDALRASIDWFRTGREARLAGN